MKNDRNFAIVEYTIADGNNLSTEVHDWSAYAGGSIYVDGTITTTNIDFYVAPKAGLTRRQYQDHDGAALVLTAVASNEMHELPPELFGAGLVQLNGVTAQTGQDATFWVLLKA